MRVSVTWRRLFVYAAIAALFVVATPTPSRLLAGALIVTLGLGIRVWATGYLYKNQELTTQGPYAYVRHPLYVGTLLAMTGFVIASSGGTAGARIGVVAIYALGLAVFLLYYLPYKAKVEGDRLVRRFGDDAERYLRQVPNLLPVRRPFLGKPAPWRWSRVLQNNEHWTCFAAAIGLVVLCLKGSAA